MKQKQINSGVASLRPQLTLQTYCATRLASIRTGSRAELLPFGGNPAFNERQNIDYSIFIISAARIEPDTEVGRTERARLARFCHMPSQRKYLQNFAPFAVGQVRAITKLYRCFHGVYIWAWKAPGVCLVFVFSAIDCSHIPLCWIICEKKPYRMRELAS